MTIFAMSSAGHVVCPVSQTVDHVCAVSIPPQVLQSVVQSIAVAVTCLHARGAGANKRQQYGSVGKETFPNPSVSLAGDAAGDNGFLIPPAKAISKSQPLELPVRIGLVSRRSRNVSPVVCRHQLASCASIIHPITA